MRRFALILALWAPDPAVADWVKMSGEEISEALTGRTLVYLDKDDPTQRVDTLQDFRASGKT
ncbi:MAG: hypothetical protein AAFS01_16415, partial [Pseudomonadota bacterium]